MIFEKIKVYVSWSDGRYYFEKFDKSKHSDRDAMYVDENLYDMLVEHEKRDAAMQDILCNIRERRNEELDANRMREELHKRG